jgi:hypothetical protein
MTPFWLETMRTINLTVKLGNLEQEVIQANNNDWMFQFNVPYTLAKVQGEVLDKLNFWYKGCLYFASDVYWCGCLTLEPWCWLTGALRGPLPRGVPGILQNDHFAFLSDIGTTRLNH